MKYIIIGIYILLNHFVSSETINTENCNELFGMTNSMNKQPLYSVKIYSCVVIPSLTRHSKQPMLNLSNQTGFNEHNNSNINPGSPGLILSNLSPSSSQTSPSPSSSQTSPSPSSSQTSPSPSSSQTSPSPNVLSHDPIIPSNKSPSPSNDLYTISSTLTMDSLTKITSPSPSSTPSDIDSPIPSDNTALIISITCGSILLLMVSVFIIFKYKNNKIVNDNITRLDLKNQAAKTMPHVYGKSPSSKTDDTILGAPRPSPPLEPPSNYKTKNLPALPNNLDIETGIMKGSKEEINDTERDVEGSC